MASPESSNRNFGERVGNIVRSAGIFFAAVGIVAPALLVPSIGLAISGEALRRISEDD